MCRYDPEGEYDTDTDTEVTGTKLNWDKLVTGLGGCQVGQFNCLGQAPEYDTADSSCEVCFNHFESCLKKRLVVWCQGEMANYDNMWCLGEVCQYDTDTGDEVGFNSNREEHAIPTVTARRKELETVKEDIHPELCQNDTDTGDDYNARTLWEASLDTGCWYDRDAGTINPCQG